MEIKQKTLLESENGFEQIFEYICIKILLRTNIRIYSYPKSWHKRISEYIRIQKMIRTNIRLNIQIKNIRIFKYIRHTLICEQFWILDILLLRLLQRIVTSLGVTRLIELIFSLHFRGMFNTSQCSVFLYQSSSYKVEG